MKLIRIVKETIFDFWYNKVGIFPFLKIRKKKLGAKLPSTPENFT